MTEPFGIIDLLKSRGFPTDRPTKLVRHRGGHTDFQKLISDGWFDLYQASQGNDIFKGQEYIVAFLGYGGTRSKLYGIYRVKGTRERRESDFPSGYPFSGERERPGFLYDLERLNDFDDLSGRVVIDWGGAALSWHQHLVNKPIVELLPAGRQLSGFTDYLDFVLSHDELTALISHPEAHRDWLRRFWPRRESIIKKPSRF